MATQKPKISIVVYINDEPYYLVEGVYKHLYPDFWDGVKLVAHKMLLNCGVLVDARRKTINNYKIKDDLLSFIRDTSYLLIEGTKYPVIRDVRNSNGNTKIILVGKERRVATKNDNGEWRIGLQPKIPNE
jgi:hypothetical protein